MDFDQDYLPKSLPRHVVPIGDRVAYSWASNMEQTINGLLIWHWCDHNVWHANPKTNPEYIPSPGWVPTGVQGHDLIAIYPLHIEPSLLFMGCCNMHGWIRNGEWIDA